MDSYTDDHVGPADPNKTVVRIILALIGIGAGTIGVIAGPKIWTSRQQAGERQRLDRAIVMLSSQDMYRFEAGLDALQAIQYANLADIDRKRYDDAMAKHAEQIAVVNAAKRAKSPEPIRADHSMRQDPDSPTRRTPNTPPRQSVSASIASPPRMPVGGRLVALLPSVAIALGGFVLIGLGQLITAIRDIAVNSYLAVEIEDNVHPRTRVPPGMQAPPYRFIAFVARWYYVSAAVTILAAIVWAALVLAM